MSQPTGLAASVRQRLLNRARAEGRPFQELLQYFAMERFLFRMANSPFRDKFVLKGALLMTVWRAPASRPTMDIDLSGKTSNDLARIAGAVSAICATSVEPDGVEFDRGSIQASTIREDAEYSGVRVRFNATLARARVTMQIDIGFGDVITPAPEDVEYPALLDFPAPVLRAYPKETVIAEKLEAIASRGLLNTRIKDYYDLALLSRTYTFDILRLARAVTATFEHRGTPIHADPAGLTKAYATDPARSAQWRAFARRNRLPDAHGSLEDLVAEVRGFAVPVLSAAAKGGR